MNKKKRKPHKDPTANEAIKKVHGDRIDYSKFNSYRELQDFVLKNYAVANRTEADKFIRQKMPKESYFQKKILDYLKKNVPDAFVWKETSGAYSQRGIPDINCIFNGQYYGFEVKRPFIGKLSKLQEQTMKKIREAGGVAEVVSFVEDVEKILFQK